MTRAQASCAGLSMTTGWPSCRDIAWPTSRAMMSGVPPAGTKTIKDTGREG
jgi:hypothetical protein